MDICMKKAQNKWRLKASKERNEKIIEGLKGIK